MHNLFNSVRSAVRRSRKWILVIFMMYCISCMAGIVMVHSGNSWALAYRDRIVGKALANDNSSINYIKGNRLKAAFIDFSGNLFIGSIPQTLMGLSVIIPYFTTAYQGWIGGIVSVDNNHLSRLRNIKPAMYYFIVLILQFIPYSLAIGGGLRWGMATYQLNKGRQSFKYKIDKSSLKDVFYIYMLVIPLFFIASCFEFLSNWNV